ncbi:MAG: hypothetical protein KDC98_21810 [Planctomycetes bacterium]|nr:hypothetical protein [Planctomycetota bacterium]
MRQLALLVAISLSAPCISQTIVVGPGGSYSQISAAVAAAPSGATILVRPGTYQGFQVVSKTLTILCDPSAQVAGEVFIGGIAAGQSVTLRGLTSASGWVPPTIPTPSALPKLLEISNCLGRVLIDTVDTTPAVSRVTVMSILVLWTPGIVASNCAQLVIRDSTFSANCSLTRCTTAIESSSFTGIYESNGNGQYNSPGLDVDYGSIRVGGSSSFQGAQGYYPGNPFEVTVPASAGLDLYSTDAQFVDGTAQSIRTGYPADRGGINVFSTQLRLAPRAVVNAVTGGFTGGRTPMPAIRVDGSLALGSLTADVSSEAGDLVIVLLGFAGAPVVVAPFVDPFWLNPAGFVFHAITVQPATSFTTSLPLPPAPSLAGLVLSWQAVAQGPATGFAASNPSLVVVH